MTTPGPATRVLLVNTAAAGGGAARMARTLHEGLGRQPGFESRLAVGRTRGVGDPGTVRIAPPAEVGLHVAVTRLTGLQGFGSPVASRRLLGLVRSWSPDIVHVHNLHGYYLNLDVLADIRGMGWGGPIVCTLHDTWAFTGRCAYFKDCGRWQHGCGRCPDLRRYPRTFFDTSAFMWKKKRRAFGQDIGPVLVCPSRWLANAVGASYLSHADTRVIPNGVETDLFRPTSGRWFRAAHAIPDRRPIVLFAAKDLGAERKGGHLARRVMEDLARSGLMVVTLGTAGDHALPLGPGFRHLGYVGDPRVVAEAFGAADLFCVLSLEENFPTTVLEALSSGTPVVGFSVGGIPEQVTRDCGRLVEPADVEGLLTAVRSLCGDRTELDRIGHEARRRAVSEYSVQRFVQRHLELYEELLSGA